MKIGIDLHNIRDGGGQNYIRNLLNAADPDLDGFSQIHLFGARDVLDQLPAKPFLHSHAVAAFERSMPFRAYASATALSYMLRQAGCDILYSPGGLVLSKFRPYVTISRNMMPFSPELWNMYPRFSADRFRLSLLRLLNASSFGRADGMIYLTETARDRIAPLLGRTPGRTAVIPHGVDHRRFQSNPHALKRGLGTVRQARIVYPSRLEPYKHQVEVITAIADHLWDFPKLDLQLCGPANPGYFSAVGEAMDSAVKKGRNVQYLGNIPNASLPELYAEADILVFASACENLPNILIEAMASGIPICCSRRAPMPEIAQDAAVYFDPQDPLTIAAAIREVLSDQSKALARAVKGLEIVKENRWEKTARATFSLIREVESEHRRK